MAKTPRRRDAATRLAATAPPLACRNCRERTATAWPYCRRCASRFAAYGACEWCGERVATRSGFCSGACCWHHTQFNRVDPHPEEIAAMTAEIRKGWDALTIAARAKRGAETPALTIPIYASNEFEP